jgi:hypothetical protein
MKRESGASQIFLLPGTMPPTRDCEEIGTNLGGFGGSPPCAFPNFLQGFSAGLQTDGAARRFTVCETHPAYLEELTIARIRAIVRS